MRTRLAPLAIAPAALLAAAAGCSLLAPSDAELMGGGRADAGRVDAAGDASGTDGAGADGPGDAAGGGDGACSQVADDCTTASCCSGLLCDPTAQICVPCTAAGGSCFPADNTCCSGSCAGHTCK